MDVSFVAFVFATWSETLVLPIVMSGLLGIDELLDVIVIARDKTSVFDFEGVFIHETLK